MTAPSSSVAAVLVDANELYSRVLRDFVLYSADAELISVMWSRSILKEVTRHLIANIDGFTESSSRRLIDAMNGAFPYAEITPRAHDYGRLAELTLPDEDDRHVIAAAVAGGATVLCTANVKDFPVSVLADFGIEVRHPDELLGSLVDRHPDVMMGVLETAAASLTGATHESTLAALGRAGASRTANMLERILTVTEPEA